MNLDTPISQIMTSNVLFVHFNDEVKDVEKLMLNKHIRHVPVIKEGKLSGIISLTDLDRLCFTRNYSNADVEDDLPAFDMLTIDQIMRTNPMTLPMDASIRDAAILLTQHEFHALPVVDTKNSEILVGIITTTDLMKFLLAKDESTRMAV